MLKESSWSVYLRTGFFESQHTPEHRRKKIIQIQQFVTGVAEGFCRMLIKQTEYLIFTACTPGDQRMFRSRLYGVWFAEKQRNGESVNPQIGFPVTGGYKSLDKVLLHLCIGKCDGCAHGEFFRFIVLSHAESGQPPVMAVDPEERNRLAASLRTVTVFAADFAERFRISITEQDERKGQHLFIRNTVEKGFLVILRRENCIRNINADLCAGIDSVLPFPEFDQPCLIIVIKINRFAVKHHVEVCGVQIEKGMVTEAALPGIDGGRDHILRGKIGETVRFKQFVEQDELMCAVHASYFADDFVSAEMKQKEKE